MKTSTRLMVLGTLLAASSVAGAQNYGPRDEGRKFNDGSRVVCKNVEVQRNTRDPNRITGTATGAVVGGLLGNQVGGGNGRTLATIAGAVGGAYAGNRVERNMHKVTYTDVRVRMAKGGYRTFTEQGQSRFGNGDRVRVQGGRLVRG